MDNQKTLCLGLRFKITSTYLKYLYFKFRMNLHFIALQVSSECLNLNSSVAIVKIFGDNFSYHSEEISR